MTPERISLPDLAELWKLSEERVRQFVKAGRLSRDSDGMFNFAKAVAFRAAALNEEEARTLFSSYSSPDGIRLPKIYDHLQTELSVDEILGIEPTTAASQDAMLDAVHKHATLTQLRAEELRMKLERQSQRNQREDGKLIDRRDVFRTTRDAAAEIAAMMRTLEFEIPALFTDADVRKEVREKVQRLVDRALYALHKKFDALARPLDEEDDDPLS